MSVKGLTCGSCGEELAYETITTDAGATVNVSKCPADCGQIKSPQCCGNDMHNH
tara:strand:- start:65 stop:226 length:162 start_codon:yes stop_codon:yes gene_type:complete